MYSTFPAGWPGLGLLLLRVTVGGILVAQSVGNLDRWRGMSPLIQGIALLEVSTGTALCAGYLTPFAALLGGTLRAAGALSLFQLPDPDFLTATGAMVPTFAILVALICIGPGAFSADARIFGRREIIIPDGGPPK